ncbi:DNA mismatch repair protein PMS1 [Acorus gramineus]|uniref:DNA mismatch repair protein PMS1 n=1 Tax=Acorus gramineus TaxID=55184 RepID=A0AAV9BP05_ACOGR|nr:DNA mismatch repair protein PMS1 [Acorus gramineus]
MEQRASESPTIKPINKAAIHRICSGQVILDLSSAVKELVENSLDAGASNVEVSLKEYGQEYFKVIDNGCGISPDNFQVLALKHHTSKIMDFPDLQSLTTFGFRGEALSSLCALGDLTIETRTENEAVGTHLKYDHSGLVTSERKVARQIGTTVTVEKLFSPLPVRSKEFSRNIRREYGKLISLLNAYALIAKGVRFICTNTTGKNVKSVVLKTQGSNSLKDNIITVFGMNTFTCLDPFSPCISGDWKVEGFLSKPGFGCGRNMGDRQFFYINGRPVDMPKVSKLVNEVYRTSNSKQYPIVIMNFTVPAKAYDVNVTPDKRKVFLSDEGPLMLSLRETIEKIYSPSHCNYSLNAFEEPRKTLDDSVDLVSSHEEEESNGSLKQIYTNKSELEVAVCIQEKIRVDMPCKKVDRIGEESIEYDNKQVATPVSENFIHGVHKISKFPVSSCNQYKRLTDSRKLSSKIDGDATVKKVPQQSFRSPCAAKVVQSSLTKFITSSKRKHETECKVLSEVPLLRNEMRPCQVRKTCSEMYAAISRNLSGIGKISPGDSSEVTSEKISEHCKASHMLNGQGSSLNVEARSEEVSFNCEDNASCGDDAVGTLEDSIVTTPLLDLPNETVDSPKTCSSPVICSTFEFNINDLRMRRSHRLSRLRSSTFTCEKMKTKRHYTSASLEISQPENDEGKANALAAAVTELERFFKIEDFRRMKVVGQFNLGFIIGKVDEDLFIVDQHAADEKYNFERLSQSTILNQQPLLQPIRLELSPEEEVIVSMHVDIIRKNGFSLMEDVHASPGNRYLLRAVPFSKNITFGVEDMKDLISTLADGKEECSILSSYRMDTSDSLCPSRVRLMLASRACRSSVMIGDALGRKEMQKILENLASLRSPWNCPHGRPTMRHLIDLRTVCDDDSVAE